MGDWMISHTMNGKLLRQTLDKFMKAPVAQEARVQVVLPNGEFYDINNMQQLFAHQMWIAARAADWPRRI